MITFEVKGSVAQTIRVDGEGGKETTEYITRWFNCAYDPKTKTAFYLRAGGVQGKALEFSPALIATLTK